MFGSVSLVSQPVPLIFRSIRHLIQVEQGPMSFGDGVERVTANVGILVNHFAQPCGQHPLGLGVFLRP